MYRPTPWETSAVISYFCLWKSSLRQSFAPLFTEFYRSICSNMLIQVWDAVWRCECETRCKCKGLREKNTKTSSKIESTWNVVCREEFQLAYRCEVQDNVRTLFEQAWWPSAQLVVIETEPARICVSTWACVTSSDQRWRGGAENSAALVWKLNVSSVIYNGSRSTKASEAQGSWARYTDTGNITVLRKDAGAWSKLCWYMKWLLMCWGKRSSAGRS